MTYEEADAWLTSQGGRQLHWEQRMKESWQCMVGGVARSPRLVREAYTHDSSERGHRQAFIEAVEELRAVLGL